MNRDVGEFLDKPTDCHAKGAPHIPIPNLIEKYSVYVVQWAVRICDLGIAEEFFLGASSPLCVE
jgi:hypothetical protein